MKSFIPFFFRISMFANSCRPHYKCEMRMVVVLFLLMYSVLSSHGLCTALLPHKISHSFLNFINLFIYFRVLIFKKVMRNSAKFLRAFYEESWMTTSGCKRLLVQHLQHLRRYLGKELCPCYLFWNIYLIDIFCVQEAAEELAPFLDIILQHLMCAFGKYQVF